MTEQNFTVLFPTYSAAAAAVADLEKAGIPHSAVSIVSNNASNEPVDSYHEKNVSLPYSTYSRDHAAVEGAVLDVASDEEVGAGVGATVGTFAGGAVGILAGLGMLVIPGVGPIVAAGWLVAAITGAGIGAGTGGLIGALVSSGENEEDATYYADGVQKGGAIVTVRTSADQIAMINDVITQHGGSSRAVTSSMDQSTVLPGTVDREEMTKASYESPTVIS